MAIRKPIAGQLSLLPGVPPVMYCRACGRMLRSEASRGRGLGPTCARREDQGLVSLLICGLCGEPLRDDEPVCFECGMGYDEFPVRVRREWKPAAEAVN